MHNAFIQPRAKKQNITIMIKGENNIIYPNIFFIELY